MLEEIEKLLGDLSCDKPKEAVDEAMQKLLQIDKEQAVAVLLPSVEDAVRKAAYESDYVWLGWIKDLVREMELEDYLSPKVSSLLEFEGMFFDIQF